MPDLITELNEQPLALRNLVRYYAAHPGEIPIQSSSRARLVIFTGMGASYHAAIIAAAQAGTLGMPAVAIETTDLVNYHATALLQRSHTLVYVSQSGQSPEVSALIEQNHGRSDIIAVTNDPDSLLGKEASAVLPIFAPQTVRMATKNYVNSLAALWLLVRRWAGIDSRTDLDFINGVSVRMERLIGCAPATTQALMEAFSASEPMVFLGHGPHAATAHQSALMMSEWVRTPCQYASVGAFRHGFVETVRPKMGALFFAPRGRSYQSALNLAHSLPELGVTVRRIAFGELCDLEEPAQTDNQTALDEFLSPILDIIPVQYFVEALAKEREVTADFGMIDKVRGL